MTLGEVELEEIGAEKQPRLRAKTTKIIDMMAKRVEDVVRSSVHCLAQDTQKAVIRARIGLRLAPPESAG